MEEGGRSLGRGAGLSITGGERAEQEEAERGPFTGQSSIRTHTSSGRSALRSIVDGSPFFFRHVPLEERCDVTSSLSLAPPPPPLSLDSEEADSTEEEDPVRFHVPTRGRDVDCCCCCCCCCCLELTPLLFSRFHVPVRLKRDDEEDEAES